MSAPTIITAYGRTDGIPLYSPRSAASFPSLHNALDEILRFSQDVVNIRVRWRYNIKAAL